MGPSVEKTASAPILGEIFKGNIRERKKLNETKRDCLYTPPDKSNKEGLMSLHPTLSLIQVYYHISRHYRVY